MTYTEYERGRVLSKATKRVLRTKHECEYLSDGGSCFRCGKTASDNLHTGERQKKLDRIFLELKYNPKEIDEGIKEAANDPSEILPVPKTEYDSMQAQIYSLKLGEISYKRQVKVLTNCLVFMTVAAFVYSLIIIWKFRWL